MTGSLGFGGLFLGAAAFSKLTCLARNLGFVTAMNPPWQSWQYELSVQAAVLIAMICEKLYPAVESSLVY